jgi:hypothetical protein
VAVGQPAHHRVDDRLSGPSDTCSKHSLCSNRACGY